MKKLLFIAMACVLSIGLVGGAFAYFSDTETSTGNIFTAGSLNLFVGVGGDLGDHFTAPIGTVGNLAPGATAGPYTVAFQNAGTINGVIRVNFDYANADVSPQTGEFAGIDADFAKALYVFDAKLGAAPDNKATYWANQIIALYTNAAAAETDGAVVFDGVYLPTIYGLKQVTLGFYEGAEVVWTPGMTASEVFTLKVANVGNDYQFDGVNINLTATLTQN